MTRTKAGNLTLDERYLIMPASVFSTRSGKWQQRKRLWRDLIADKGETRQNTLFISPTMRNISFYTEKSKIEEHLGKKITTAEFIEKYYIKKPKKGDGISNGVSILDPVICEIANLWFAPDEAKVVDPFAGDTVMGYVTTMYGNTFTGIELRKEQCEINQERVDSIKNNSESHYHCDDGRNVLRYVKPVTQDLLFSCPPYFDLEKYSDDPNDASNQETYGEFLDLITDAFSNAIKALKNNRFAYIIISDVRDKVTGFYHNLPEDIIDIFKSAGMYLYNEIILVDQVGSLSFRIDNFMKTRKTGRTHQKILVFYKGDPQQIGRQYPSHRSIIVKQNNITLKLEQNK